MKRVIANLVCILLISAMSIGVYWLAWTQCPDTSRYVNCEDTGWDGKKRGGEAPED